LGGSEGIIGGELFDVRAEEVGGDGAKTSFRHRAHAFTKNWWGDVMRRRIILRVILVILLVLGLVSYMAAKYNFFAHFDPFGMGGYTQQHSIYWAIMAAIVLVILIVERLFPSP
jgi:hypothetical protein